MPPKDYLLAHPEARLTQAERAELARGLAATLGGEAGGKEGRWSEGSHDEGEDDERDGD